MFKKYSAIYRYMLIRSLQFRTELVIYTFLDILPFFVLVFAWQAVFQGQETIKSFTLPEITQYYLLVMLVERMTSTYFESWRAREIREGKIDYFLTRPFSYINEVFSKDVGGKLVSITITVPFLILFALVINSFIPVSTLSLTPEKVIIFLLFMVVAYVMQFFIAFWIVLLTFWFEGSSGIEHFKWITVSLFSGSMLPVEFMPSWLQTFYQVLPLKFMYAVPIRYLQGSLELTGSMLFQVALTLTVMFLLTKLFWKKATYLYSSAGG